VSVYHELPEFHARKRRLADSSRIALVTQGQLQAAGLCEAADRWRPQRGDPVEPGGLEDLLDPRLGDHAAIADQPRDHARRA
jgi:hypothetical protein